MARRAKRARPHRAQTAGIHEHLQGRGEELVVDARVARPVAGRHLGEHDGRLEGRAVAALPRVEQGSRVGALVQVAGEDERQDVVGRKEPAGQVLLCPQVDLLVGGVGEQDRVVEHRHQAHQDERHGDVAGADRLDEQPRRVREDDGQHGRGEESDRHGSTGRVVEEVDPEHGVAEGAGERYHHQGGGERWEDPSPAQEPGTEQARNHERREGSDKDQGPEHPHRCNPAGSVIRAG